MEGHNVGRALSQGWNPRHGNQAVSPGWGKGRYPVRKPMLPFSQVPGTPEQGNGHGVDRRPQLPHPDGHTGKLVTEGSESSREEDGFSHDTRASGFGDL